MALLSARGEELGLIDRVVGSVLLLLALAAPSAAQEKDEIRGFVAAGGAVTGVHGDLTALFTVEAGLGLSADLRVGGIAVFQPTPRDVGPIAFQDLELTFGYGGLYVEALRDAPMLSARWVARLVVGAGNADVRDTATGVRLDSDNFVVLQPGVGVELPVFARLRVAAGVSWRLVSGVQDLRGVASADLRSPSFDVRLRLGRL